jgi:uncharacterized protein YdeI (YjbR/CyaY-like superfamily)
MKRPGLRPGHPARSYGRGAAVPAGDPIEERPMPPRDPRVDAYIASAAAFARPILAEIRERVHRACPGITETIKWRSISFEKEGIVCGAAAFKQHCSFGFWKNDLVVGGDPKAAEAAEKLGRLAQVREIPPKPLFAALLKKAVKLNVDGIRQPRPKAAPKALTIPPALKAALRKNRKAGAAFAAFPPGQRREYAEWIADAKRDDTRARRVAQAVEWIAERKPRNWKYMSC